MNWFAQFSWMAHAVGVLFFLWILRKYFHLDLATLLKVLTNEFKDLIKNKKSVGAYNMGGAILMFVFGVFTILALKFEHAFNLLASLIGKDKVSELHQSASLEIFFYIIAAYITLSIAFTFVDSKKRK